MTKLQLIPNYGRISIITVYWHNGCHKVNKHELLMFIK